MDTPWLNIFSTNKLSWLQLHTLQLTSELTASKWLTVHNLLLEGLYRDRGREKEARLKLYTPAVSYVQVRKHSEEQLFLTGSCWNESSSSTVSELHSCVSSVTFQAGGWGVLGKRSVKASASLSTLWTPPIGGDVSLESSKSSQTLHVSATCSKHNASVTAALRNVAEVRLGRENVQYRRINNTDICCLFVFCFFVKGFEKEAGGAEDNCHQAKWPQRRGGAGGSHRGAEKGQEDVPENSDAAAQVSNSV